MSNQDRKLAYFYNFKDEPTCPFCRMVKELFDQGGNQLVAEKLGLLLDNGFEHSFLDCFVHHYWLDAMYNDNVKRTLGEIVEEGFGIFRGMKRILQIA